MSKNNKFVRMHQISHLNLEHKIGLKQMMNEEVHTILVLELNLKQQC